MANTYTTAKNAIENAERRFDGFLLFTAEGEDFRIYSARMTAEDISSYFISVMDDMPDVREKMQSYFGGSKKSKSGLII